MEVEDAGLVLLELHLELAEPQETKGDNDRQEQLKNTKATKVFPGEDKAENDSWQPH